MAKKTPENIYYKYFKNVSHISLYKAINVYEEKVGRAKVVIK